MGQINVGRGLGMMEPDHTQIATLYADLMEEAKARIAAIDTAINKTTALLPPTFIPATPSSHPFSPPQSPVSAHWSLPNSEADIRYRLHREFWSF